MPHRNIETLEIRAPRHLIISAARRIPAAAGACLACANRDSGPGGRSLQGLRPDEAGGGPKHRNMLRVPTYVAPSPIAGVGLFAATRLPTGTIIWEYTEGVDWQISSDELETFPEPYRSRIRHYVYEDDTGIYVLCGDNAKFMNHHPRPNCSDVDPRYTKTTRVVRAGEELTCDYREFDALSRKEGLRFERARRAG
jgi:hypothetical protein